MTDGRWQKIAIQTAPPYLEPCQPGAMSAADAEKY